jgi:NADH-quinone oxidoreductase subunit E
MMETAKVDLIMQKASSKKTQLIGILQDVQKEYGYLPFKALARIAEALEIPLQQIYNVVTFYKAFSLKPRGKHRICVCLGTACHVRGGQNVLEQFERTLGAKEGGTTADGAFSIEAVRCVGACSLAPVVMIDEEVQGRVKQSKIKMIIDKYRKNGSDKKEKDGKKPGSRKA